MVSLPTDFVDKRYKIRVINHGEPSLQDHPMDKERLVAVAVLIDGVNSIYQDQGDENHTIGPVVVHPNKAKKWVISGPGKKIVVAPDGMTRKITHPTDPSKSTESKIEGVMLVDVPKENGKDGIGNSQIDVLGFQTEKQTSAIFQFAEAKDSIAEMVGIIDQVGLISVYFYPEILPLIHQSSPAGTKAGAEIANKVFPIDFKREVNPIEAIHIVYRYEDQLPCKPEELELITQ